MRKVVRLLVTVCVLAMSAVALSACSGGKSDSASSEIIVGIPQDLEDSLDPHKAVAAGTKEVLFNIYEGLLKPDSQGNLIPAVAKDYSVSEDGLTYSFTLRDGITFHNGNPVTAEDVKYSLEKSAGMMGGEPIIAAFSNIAEINIKDGNVIDIVLNAEDVDFPAYVANINASVIPKDNADPDTNPIGTGPYMYTSRSPQENFVCKRYDGYWGEAANIESVVFKIVPNADAIVMNLNGGTVDMFARLTQSQVDQLSGDFDVLEGTMNLVQAVYLNNSFEPFKDVRVRQALSYACDVQEILDITSAGKGSPVGSSMYPAFKKYYVDLSDKYPVDIEKAKELLKEAGYENGFSFSISVPSNYQPHIDAAQVYIEQLKKIGVTADIKLVEWNSWLSDVYSGRNFEATLVGVDASSMTARAMLERFNSEASNNFINYSNPDYDDLYKQAISTTDDAKQVELYQKMQTILCEDAANVYIQDMAEFVALNKKFEGYEFYPLYVQDISKIRLKVNQ